MCFATRDWCNSRCARVPAWAEMFLQVVRAVAYVHGRGVVHRDLKPSNVMVSSGGIVKLLDFGIAKHVDAAQDDSSPSPGSRWMTRSHAAPEQLRGGATGVFTDVYALGVVLYELLADRQPFDPTRRTPEAAPPPPPCGDAELARICLTAMQLAPRDRQASVKALMEELDFCLEHDVRHSAKAAGL